MKIEFESTKVIDYNLSIWPDSKESRTTFQELSILGIVHYCHIIIK